MATNVQLENVQFSRSGIALEMHPGAPGSTLKMENVEVAKALSGGIVLTPPAAGTPLKVWLNNVRVSKTGGSGLLINANTSGVISNSTFDNNNNGVYVAASSVHVSLVRDTLSNNTTNGFIHSVAGITTLMDGCSIVSNGTGVANTGSNVIGYGTNVIGYNNMDVTGNPIQTIQGQ